MTYEHLYEKMMKEQAKLMPRIEQLQDEGKLPDDLCEGAGRSAAME